MDLRAVADIAHAHGAVLVVDNVFATPSGKSRSSWAPISSFIRRPSTWTGRAARWAGHLGRKELIEGDIHTIIRQTGPSMSPFNAWVLLKSLETLPLRVKAMTEGAAKLADFFASHPKIERVSYPFHPSHPQHELARRQMGGGSTLIALTVKGGKEAAFRMADALAIVAISNNLGDAKSIISHPATTTHQRFSDEDKAEMGITEGLLRLSVGLEDPDDLIADFTYALDKS